MIKALRLIFGVIVEQASVRRRATGTNQQFTSIQWRIIGMGLQNFKLKKYQQCLIVAYAIAVWSHTVEAQQNQQDQQTRPGVRVIEPDKQVRSARAAAIDTERFEFGAYLGKLSVEDFGSDVIKGLELSYHLNDKIILQGNYGVATIDRAAFETNISFLSDSDRDFKTFSLVAGYKLLTGRSFLGARKKYDSDIYFLAGPDRVSFAGSEEWGLNFGLSYRLVLTDWMTLNVDFREHMFKRDFIGEEKQTLNTEFRIGLNGLF